MIPCDSDLLRSFEVNRAKNYEIFLSIASHCKRSHGLSIFLDHYRVNLLNDKSSLPSCVFPSQPPTHTVIRLCYVEKSLQQYHPAVNRTAIANNGMPRSAAATIITTTTAIRPSEWQSYGRSVDCGDGGTAAIIILRGTTLRCYAAIPTASSPPLTNHHHPYICFTLLLHCVSISAAIRS